MEVLFHWKKHYQQHPQCLGIQDQEVKITKIAWLMRLMRINDVGKF